MTVARYSLFVLKVPTFRLIALVQEIALMYLHDGVKSVCVCVKCSSSGSPGAVQLCQRSDIGVVEADVSSVVSGSVVLRRLTSRHRPLLRQSSTFGFRLPLLLSVSLQCFDTVCWVTRRASGL